MDESSGKPWYRRWFGTRSERGAARYLKALGYRIVARNFSCKLGELDLVALDNGTIVFVEVRSTERGDVARPAASVDAAKQQRLTRLALYFLQKKRLLNHAARFDVVCIAWPPGEKTPTIEHFKNAFEAHGRFQMYS
jgi:putative endonuclease